MNMSSGREEGEIDSEEDGLRKRITELEEENAKYEKIRCFADCYEDKYGDVYELNEYNDLEAIQRAGQVPTDVSSISSVEFPTPKKKKHKRNKKRKCKGHAGRNNRCSHQRHKHCKTQQLHGEKRHHHHHHHHHYQRERVVLNPYYESHVGNGIETISLDSTDLSDYEKDNYSIAAMEIESPDEDYETTLPLSREELRLALGRSAGGERKNNAYSLKERLQPEKLITIEKNIENEDNVQIFENATSNSNDNKNALDLNSDNSISIEEHELRLIALRSAIMKKHATRKKRNAEVAYSPTDFDDLVVEPISIVDSEIEELNGDMEISPGSSPRLILTPIQCDEEQNSNISLETIDNSNEVDNKPIDMDIASSNSEHEDSMLPTHEIPLPDDAPPKCVSITMPYDYTNHNGAAIRYEMFMPQMHNYGMQLEMPQTILPMPGLQTTASTTMIDMNSNISVGAEESGIVIEKSTAMNNASPMSYNMDITTDETQQEQPVQEGTDEEEEEAEALRALLLSRRQTATGRTSKVNGIATLLRRNSPLQVLNVNETDCKPNLEVATMSGGGIEENISQAIPQQQPLPLQLPNIQISATESVNSICKPTESILKEALRRLKVKTVREDEPIINKPAVLDELEVPRLKIKSFARISVFNEEEEREVSANNDSSHSSDALNNSMNRDETNMSFDMETQRSAPEILGIQSGSLENTTAQQQKQSLKPKKRRHENDVSLAGRTLRIIELKQATELSCQQHSSENNNSVIALEKTQTRNEYDAQAKKFKTTTESVNPSGGNGKEDAQQEHAVKEWNNVSVSFEKENKEITTVETDPTHNDVVMVKAKSTAKLVNKNARMGGKRKISPLTIATKTANSASKSTTKQTAANKAVLPKENNIAPSKMARQVKIVKPNKVINKNVTVQQNAQKTSAASVQKSNDASAQTQTHTRILTPATIPNVKVNKLIIRVGNAESSSEDEEILRHQTLERCIGLTTARTSTPDSLTSVLNENIYSNKLGTATAVELKTNDEHLKTSNEDMSNASSRQETMTANSEMFEKKLEDFLKNMRSKTQSKSGGAGINEIEHARIRKISASGNKQTAAGTPTAVRSLPAASQEEYKRLVHRMKILEKQKNLKKLQKSLLEDAEKYSKSKQNNSNQISRTNVIATTEIGTQTPRDTDESNVQNKICTTKIESIAPQQQHVSNENVEMRMTTKSPTKSVASGRNVDLDVAKVNLERREILFTKISNNIVTRLDKSMKLVNDVKVAKIAKLRHEQRLKELRLEMEQTQRKMKDEQFKMSRIYPEICANNELITKLKQKRTKLLEMTMKLGKSVKGDDYRLNNNFKNEITLKTKGLATHIKLVNSITYCDLDKLDKETTILANNGNNNVNNDSNVKTDCLENNLEIVQKIVPTSNVESISKNVESSKTPKSPAKEANAEIEQQKNAQGTEIDYNSLNLSTASVDDDNLLQTQVATEKDCDKMCEVPSSQTIAIGAVKTAEEMPPPSFGGIEVSTRRDSDDDYDDDGQQKKEDVEEGKEEKGAENEAIELSEPNIQSVRHYVSPLVHFKSEVVGKWDPNDIICPYELMGQCEDKECSYKHFEVK